MQIANLFGLWFQALEEVAAKASFVETVDQEMTLLREIDREEMIESPRREYIVEDDRREGRDVGML